MSRRVYERHIGDAVDRFLTERCKDEHGRFSMARMIALVEALEMPENAIPAEGTNGTKRMTLGILMRSWFADGVLRFRDGTTIRLEESP